MTKEQIYDDALNKFGEDNQTKKFIEECSELIRAICRDELDNIEEEFADFEIMAEQFKRYRQVSAEAIEEKKQYKLDRLRKLVS